MGIDQKVMDAVRKNMNIAATPKAAIEMARTQGFKISTAQENEILSTLNGSKAWGQFDGFEKSDSQMFMDDLSQAMKDDPSHAFGVAGKKAVARDVQKNPDKYMPKRYNGKSGNYMVYQKDSSTGKDTYKYYDKNGKAISEGQFNKNEGTSSVRYDSKSGKFLAKSYNDDSSAKSWSECSTGEKVASVALFPLALLGGIFTSCKEEEEHIIPVAPVTFINNISIVFDNTSLVTAMNEANLLNAKIVNLLEQINNNTNKTNQEIAELKAEIQKLQQQLNDIKQQIVTVIANQRDFAKSADDYFKQIVQVIGDNGELLKFIVEQLTTGNETLSAIKTLMEQNNATDKEILEAVTKCKYGIDELHEDNKEIKALITTLTQVVAKLPDEMKDKFSGFFKSIITGITDNGAKLDALTNLLKVVNANMQAGHTAILEKMDEMKQVIDNLYAKFSEFDVNIQKALAAIATAIANMSAKIDKIDLSKIENTLTQILEKIGSNTTQLESMTKLLEAINTNTKINGETQVKILNAINKYGAGISASLTAIIDKMNNAPDIEAKIDELIAVLNKMDANNEERTQRLIAAIANLGVNIQGSLTAILNKIGNDDAKWNKLFELLEQMDANNGERNEKLLAAIAKLGVDISGSLSVIISKMNNDPGKWDELLAFLAKMDANNATRNQKLLDAIANLGLSVNSNLSAILAKIGNDTGKWDELLALLSKMDANNATRNQKILDAIAKLGTDMTAEFAKLIQIGNDNNALQTKTNELINTVISLIENLDIKPGDGGTTTINLQPLLQLIDAVGTNLDETLQAILSMLRSINGSVIEGNNENNKTLKLILNALSNKTDDPDFYNKVLKYLDAILKAIKDHKVIITINSDGSVNCSGDVNEGVQEGLDWLLG